MKGTVNVFEGIATMTAIIIANDIHAAGLTPADVSDDVLWHHAAKVGFTTDLEASLALFDLRTRVIAAF